MGIRQTLRDQPRLATAVLAVVGLAIAGGGIAVLQSGGGDGGSQTTAAQLEAEEIERIEREIEEAQTTSTETSVRERITTTQRPTTTRAPTTVPPSTAPNTGGPVDVTDGGPDDGPDDGTDSEPIAEVTTTQPGGDAVVAGTRIIRELTSPVRIYETPALNAPVVGELGIAASVEVQERRDGWYRIESESVSGWAFGAYVVPSPDPDFLSMISIDGSTLQPQYADGELVPDTYEPGKYAIGYVEPDGNRTLIFLPDGLVVYIPSNQVRPVQ